jgi:hypothetical protein
LEGTVTESEIQCLENNIDKTVGIETSEGEQLIAKVLFVDYDKEYDEHELLYQVVSSSMPELYSQHEYSGAYVLDFDKIVSVRPLS